MHKQILDLKLLFLGGLSSCLLGVSHTLQSLLTSSLLRRNLTLGAQVGSLGEGISLLLGFPEPQAGSRSQMGLIPSC